jgi:hypothetical protein
MVRVSTSPLIASRSAKAVRDEGAAPGLTTLSTLHRLVEPRRSQIIEHSASCRVLDPDFQGVESVHSLFGILKGEAHQNHIFQGCGSFGGHVEDGPPFAVWAYVVGHQHGPKGLRENGRGMESFVSAICSWEAVMERRRLTDDEKERVKAWATEKARCQHPKARITVVVSDAIDDSGFAHVTVVITETTPVALEEIASNRERVRDAVARGVSGPFYKAPGCPSLGLSGSNTTTLASQL